MADLDRAHVAEAVRDAHRDVGLGEERVDQEAVPGRDVFLAAHVGDDHVPVEAAIGFEMREEGALVFAHRIDT